MPSGYNMTPYQRNRVIQLLKADVEVEFIVERMGYCKQTIYNIAKEEGLLLTTETGDKRSTPLHSTTTNVQAVVGTSRLKNEQGDQS